MNTKTPRSRNFKPFLTEESTILPDRNKKTVTRIVNVNVSEIEKMIDLYRWRTETQFPIAKIKNVELLLSQAQGKSSTFTRGLEVRFQELTFTTADIDDVPLFRMLYLLKQTLIGLERLFSKFGSFFLTEKMIFIDQTGKCKVWINEQVELNQFEANRLNESEFLVQVFWMFKAKTAESKQSAAFYEGIKICKSFFSVLEYLESFVEKQKIKVLTYFKIQASSNGTTSLEKKKKKMDMNLTLSKKPNFLVNMEFSSSKEDSLTSSKKDIFGSVKFISPRVYFSKPEMKISGDTAAESQKNIKSSNDCGGFSPVMYSRKGLTGKGLFNSNKSERIQSKLDVVRKFSQINQQSSPTIEIHGPIKFPAPSYQHEILNENSESITFCDGNGKTSGSSSVDNKQKLIEKKKQVFNFNGWQQTVKSLFSNDSEFQKSFCKKNDKTTVKREPVKLHLLDKCATNMCESFMGGQQ